MNVSDIHISMIVADYVLRKLGHWQRRKFDTYFQRVELVKPYNTATYLRITKHYPYIATWYEFSGNSKWKIPDKNCHLHIFCVEIQLDIMLSNWLPLYINNVWETTHPARVISSIATNNVSAFGPNPRQVPPAGVLMLNLLWLVLHIYTTSHGGYCPDISNYKKHGNDMGRPLYVYGAFINLLSNTLLTSNTFIKTLYINDGFKLIKCCRKCVNKGTHF